MLQYSIDFGSSYIKVLIKKDNIYKYSIVSRKKVPDIKLFLKKIGKYINRGFLEKQEIYIPSESPLTFLLKKGKRFPIENNLIQLCASYYNKEFILIDTGALNNRAFWIDSRGSLKKVVRNEKCTGGLGIFMETMLTSLDISFKDLDSVYKGSSRHYSIINGCTVFAESEVISQINRGVPKEEILKGVLLSISRKTSTLLEKIDSPCTDILILGGMGNTFAYQHSINSLYPNINFLKPPTHPQILGALSGLIVPQGEGIPLLERFNYDTE